MARTGGGLATAWQVFVVFLGLGLTSFGGPVAHLGYFRQELVARRRWLTDETFGQLVSLCHFLPGPASSQLGMAIGLRRAGVAGLIAAWVGFTTPSAVAMMAFGYGLQSLHAGGGAPWLAGLTAAAVAVVAQAVLAMAPLAAGRRRATLAVGALVAVLVVPAPLTQVVVIAGAAVIGMVWLSPAATTAAGEDTPSPVGRLAGLGCLAAFGALLVGLPLLAAATGGAGWQLASSFYQSGALVFGGGHVVLPLLEAQTVQTGLVPADTFLAGYGAAQAVPGPLVTFAAFLGFVADAPPNGIAGGLLALVAIFSPSALLIIGSYPFWERLRRSATATRALQGVNAAVVGILAAALYTPVFTAGVTGPRSVALAATCFVALRIWKLPPWLVVLGAGGLGALVLG